ncbi:MAG: tetratricopeptide repeat protein [Bacteroidales bacterium]|nr:tetratricopeptide repeat protein [Bacteroidales bacterium]
MAKKKDKTEEKIVAVEEVLGRTEQFIEKNQKILTIIVGIIVVLILGYFGYKKFYLAPLEKEAQSQIFMAEMYFEQDSLNRALYGDGNYLGFLDIIDEYSSTKTGNLANYYSGICFLKNGEFEEAIDYLKNFSSSDQIIGPMASAAIGDAYMELGDPEKSITYYLEAAGKSNNEFTAPTFLMKAAWTYEELGEYNKALKIYERIKKEFYKSYEAREIDKYIARAKSLSAKDY